MNLDGIFNIKSNPTTSSYLSVLSKHLVPQSIQRDILTDNNNGLHARMPIFNNDFNDKNDLRSTNVNGYACFAFAYARRLCIK